MDLRELFAGGNLDQSNHLMNIHHLELFYYVRVRRNHRGRAQYPYGIQQPP